jgi:hypothetical protein
MGGGGDRNRLYKVSTETGGIDQEVSLDFMTAHVLSAEQMGKLLIVNDGWMGDVWALDPDKPDGRRKIRHAGMLPINIAIAGDAMWHSEGFVPFIVKGDLEGNLLDWGEQPFERRRWGGTSAGVHGLAWDGERLWALDKAGGRICMIEKNVPEEEGR